MSRKQLKDLHIVSQLRFLQEYAKISSILREEAQIREQLMRLEQKSLQVDAPTDAIQTMSLVGADILWQSWVSRSRRQLNMELAQVLARKSDAIAGFRKAFGKRKSVEQMLRLEKDDRKKHQMRKFYDRLMSGN